MRPLHLQRIIFPSQRSWKSNWVFLSYVVGLTMTCSTKLFLASKPNLARRTVLIKSNLASKTNYLMQNLLLSSGVLEQIDKVNKDFFSNKLSFTRYSPLISWDSICSEQACGGLGFKNAKDTNTGL